VCLLYCFFLLECLQDFSSLHILPLGLESLIADLACFDETSSRFIQKRLRLGTDEERSLALATALSSFDRLWRDQNGNFLIQGLFEFGSTADKKELMEAIYGQDVVTLCLHMYGYVTMPRGLNLYMTLKYCLLTNHASDCPIPNTQLSHYSEGRSTN
jgi:Pumilio-family RNA binding repeat